MCMCVCVCELSLIVSISFECFMSGHSNKAADGSPWPEPAPDDYPPRQRQPQLLWLPVRCQCAACARLSIKYANYANYAALLDLFVALFDRQVVATLPLRIRNSVWAWHSAIAQVLSNSHSTRMSMIYTLSTHLAPSHDTRFMRQ